MPPQKALWGRAARRNIEVPKLHNAPDMQPQGEVSNFEFREAIRMLSQVVTNQVGQHRGAWKEEGDTSRIREFLRMNPQSFTRSSTTENLEKILRIEQCFWYDECYWCWMSWSSCITSETCGWNLVWLVERGGRWGRTTSQLGLFWKGFLWAFHSLRIETV